MRGLIVVAAVLACPAPLTAQPPAGVNSVDVGAVAAFADGFFPPEMDRRHIPGLVFVFVSGGQIAVVRGFGAAQLEPRRPVDPERTMFRLASVSKTITATAALQLVERGRLDLHEDVSALAGFHLAASHGPITLHHLLTHTAGLDESLTGTAARSPEDVQPLATYLARSMPPTFVEPGRVISYSNHGFALIGLLVEKASGRPFASYVREEIFEPLEMQRSGLLTARVPEDLAVAYEVVGGRYRALPPDYLQVSPAGGFFTTGTDMARFVIAHLRGGAYRDRRIVRPETVALMHARHFAQTADTSGWAYGLWEDARDGQRALLHNGGGKGYRALLYLLPQQDAGFFLAYNLADRHPEGELQEVFITRFRQRFVATREVATTRVDEPRTAAPFVGDFLYVRRARTTPEKMISVVNRVRIRTDGNGALTLTGSSGGPTTLAPIGPVLFRRADHRGVVAFDAVAGGRSDRLAMITDSGFPAVYDRIPLILTLRLQVAWLASLALAFVYAAACRPVAAVVRGARASGWDARRLSTWLAGISAALNLIFLAGFPVAFLGRIEGGVPEFLYGVPVLARILLFIPPVTALLGTLASIAALCLWRDRRMTLAARVEHTVVAIALVAFVVFARFFRVL